MIKSIFGENKRCQGKLVNGSSSSANAETLACGFFPLQSY